MRKRGWSREGWLAGVVRAERVSLMSAKREACIRRLCSTVVYDYLLTTVFFVSLLRRPLCREYPTGVYLRRSRVLFIWPSRLPAKPPCPHPALFGERCIEKRQRRVFTSLRSHNSDRQTGKPFFLSLFLLLHLLLLPLHFFRFPQALLSSTFLAILVKYFKDRLPIVHPLMHRLRFRGGYTSKNVLYLAAISLSATVSWLNCRDISIVIQYCSFRLLRMLEIDWMFLSISFFSCATSIIVCAETLRNITDWKWTNQKIFIVSIRILIISI